ANEKREHSELLTHQMHMTTTEKKKITVIDKYDPDQNEMTIPLDPNKTPNENAQQYFKRYRKLSTSKRIIEKEIVRTEDEIDYFERLLQQIEDASMEDVEEIREELREEGYLRKRRKQKRKNKQTKPTPEKYRSSDGTDILVGKNN